MAAAIKKGSAWRELYCLTTSAPERPPVDAALKLAADAEPGSVHKIGTDAAKMLATYLDFALDGELPKLANLRFAVPHTSRFYEVDAKGHVTRTTEKPAWVKSDTDLHIEDVLSRNKNMSLEEYLRDTLAKPLKERKKILSDDFMLFLNDAAPVTPSPQAPSGKAGSAFTVENLSLEDFTWLLEYLNKAVAEKKTPDLPFFESVTTGKLTREQKFGIRTYYKAVVGRTLTARPGFVGDDNYFRQIQEGLSTVKNIGVKKFHDAVSKAIANAPDVAIKAFEVTL